MIPKEPRGDEGLWFFICSKENTGANDKEAFEL